MAEVLSNCGTLDECASATSLSRSPRALFRGLYEDRGKIILGAAVIFLIVVLMSGLVARGVTLPIDGGYLAT